MTEKTAGVNDGAEVHMLPKYEEATQDGPGQCQMAPPPAYPGQQAMMAPPYQTQPPTVVYGQPNVVYGQPNVVYGQPNVVVQYPVGIGGVVATGQPAPPDYFLMSLMVTLCCFCPTGFIAVLRASDARTAVARGDLQSAHVYSKEARKYIIISVFLGIVCITVVVALYVGMILNSLSGL